MIIKKIKEFKFIDWFKNNKIQLSVIFLLTTIAYASTFNNQFLSDDIKAIVENPTLNSFKYVAERFPLVVRPFLYFLINRLFGLSPVPYHILNTFFHLGSVLTIYLLVYLLHNQTTAFVTSILAGIHPIMIEAVTWISGGPYSTYTFFVILALTFFLFGYKNKIFSWLSVISFTLGLATSAKSMSYPFILTSLIIFRPDIKLKREWKKIIIPWAIGITGIIYTATLIPHRLETLTTRYYQNPQMLNPFHQVPTAVTKYLELTFWPKALTLYHTEINLINQTEFIKSTAGFLLFAVIGIYTFIKNKKIFFWFMFSAFALGPMLTPFGVSWLVAERYAYLAMFGIFVLFGWVLDRINKIDKIKNIPLIIFLSVFVPVLTLRTIVRNNIWQNQDQLWLAAAKYSPHSAQNHNNLGDLYARHGNLEKSIFHFKKAIELRPGYADAYHNMANIYWRLGDLNTAIANYEKAQEFNPNIWQTCQNLGILYFEIGEHEKALEQMERAVQLNPNDANLYANLAKMYAKLGEEEKAQNAAAKSQQLQNQQ